MDDGDKSSLNAVQLLIKTWDEKRNDELFDPYDLMCQFAALFEKESERYWASNPDPFDERHPSRVVPDCQYGAVLKCFFKKESLVQEIFNNYIRDNYYSRRSDYRSAFDLNVAVCRLMLCVLPGLELTVLVDTDGLISRLYKWVNEAEEPLRSYATGLLAVALEFSEVATDTENRERNAKLVPIMVQRLRDYSHFEDRNFICSATPNSNSLMTTTQNVQNENLPYSGMSYSSSFGGGETSNSSWAEMESQVIGHFQVFPLTEIGRQIYIMRLLTPLGEYQEFLPFIFDLDIQALISTYIDPRENITQFNSRLTFESLKFLCSLFCHKKFVMKWVSSGGIQVLLRVFRPSISSVAVSQCLYYIACDDDSMEKICLLPHSVHVELVKYVLWLIECSHISGRQFGIMFFGLATAFRVFLMLFEERDALRIVYNSIGVLSILHHGEGGFMLSDDEEYIQRQLVRQVMVSLKKYFEAHLGLLTDQLRRSHGMIPARQCNKPVRFTPEQVTEQVESLLEELPFRFGWSAVDNFVSLGGVAVCLQVIAIAYDWTFAGRAEMVKNALDVLAIVCVLPKVTQIFCESMDLPDKSKTFGINVILGAAEGEIVQDSPEVQKAALNVIINCVAAPISRPSGRICTPSGSSKRKLWTGKSSDEHELVINKVWDCVRSNNGIMALMQLLTTKSPITDADCIRALACRALVGLGRSPMAKQIMSKLPMFTSGQLQQLVKDPVLQDKRLEHVKFHRYAHELMQLVCGPGGRTGFGGGQDFSLETLRRASVVAQTKIRFSKKQLLQLIQEYLSSQGLSETAATLQKEASLILMTAKQLTHSSISRSNINSPMSNRISSSLLTNSVSHSRLSVSHSTSPMLPSSLSPTNTGNTLRFVRSTSAATVSRSATVSTSIRSPYTSMTPNMVSNEIDCYNETFLSGLSMVEKPEKPPRVTLESIVSDYLSGQHSLCPYPVVTCPDFDLFVPHKCPDRWPKSSAPLNFSSRLTKRAMFPPFGGYDGFKLDRKLVYSRFRAVKTFRCNAENSDSYPISLTCPFTSCAISFDDSFLLGGTYTGDIKLFNMSTGSEEATYNCHESQIDHIQPSRDGRLLLTSSPWRSPYSGMWSMGEFFESKLEFRNDDYVEFSKVSQDKIVGTFNEVATIYDVATGTKIRHLKPLNSNNYKKNRATFDPTDNLILNDGVLYDVRMFSEIRKLDKLNQTLSGVFHPNGLEIISNTEVWDIRTFHLRTTVSGLDQSLITFSDCGYIIYAVMLELETEYEDKYESSFKIFDATDYSSIATIETRRNVLGLCPSVQNMQLAVVENSPSALISDESVIRLYEVGMLKADEEEGEENIEDDEETAAAADDDDSEGGPGLFDGILDQTTSSSSDDDDDDGSSSSASVANDADPVPQVSSSPATLVLSDVDVEAASNDGEWEDMEDE